nr:NAD+ synthase [candidate division Zixibacteria bacterium]
MDIIISNERALATTLEKFLKDKLVNSGLKGYILGLSGGIDSSLAASIAARAIGANQIHGLMMPYKHSSGDSLADAERLVKQLGISSETIEISPMIDDYYKNVSIVNKVRLGNKMARERMSILFDRAYEMGCLVLGTSNRTEICLGYGTWYGDMACSVNPLGMLYKTQVRQMARYYDIPGSIITKTPSADLWPGQTDEGELGLEYEKVDRLLFMIIEQGLTKRLELTRAGFSDAFIVRAVTLINKFHYKRHLPEIPDLGLNPIPDNVVIG